MVARLSNVGLRVVRSPANRGGGGVDVLRPAAEVGLVGQDVGRDPLGLGGGEPGVRLAEVLVHRGRGGWGHDREEEQGQGRAVK